MKNKGKMLALILFEQLIILTITFFVIYKHPAFMTELLIIASIIFYPIVVFVISIVIGIVLHLIWKVRWWIVLLSSSISYVMVLIILILIFLWPYHDDFFLHLYRMEYGS